MPSDKIAERVIPTRKHFNHCEVYLRVYIPNFGDEIYNSVIAQLLINLLIIFVHASDQLDFILSADNTNTLVQS